MIKVIEKIILKIKKPKIVIVVEDSQSYITDFIFLIINNYFKVRKVKGTLSFSDILFGELILINSDIKEIESYNYLLKNSKESVLVFAGTDKKNYENNIEIPLNFKFLLFNSDAITISNFEKDNFSEVYSFGFSKKSDFQGTDMKINDDTNFKINFQGNIIPFWLKGKNDEKKVSAVLAGIALGKMLDLNLVNISRKIKELS